MVHSGASASIPNVDEALAEIMRLRPSYSAASTGDVLHLAFVLECAPISDQARIAAGLMYHDLMRGPWWFQGMVRFLRWRGDTFTRLTLLCDRMPEMARDLIMQSCRHIRHGKDIEQASSVGGLSQRETDLLVALLKVNADLSPSTCGIAPWGDEPNPPTERTS